MLSPEELWHAWPLLYLHQVKLLGHPPQDVIRRLAPNADRWEMLGKGARRATFYLTIHKT